MFAELLDLDPRVQISFLVLTKKVIEKPLISSFFHDMKTANFLYTSLELLKIK